MQANEPGRAAAVGGVAAGGGVGGTQKECVGGLYQTNVFRPQRISGIQPRPVVVRWPIDVYVALLDVLRAVAVGLVDVDGQGAGLGRGEQTIDANAPPGEEVHGVHAHRLPAR